MVGTITETWSFERLVKLSGWRNVVTTNDPPTALVHESASVGTFERRQTSSTVSKSLFIRAATILATSATASPFGELYGDPILVLVVTIPREFTAEVFRKKLLAQMRYAG
ncbi:hypothetical protein [Rhizobium sp.]|jgi:hypothetical protein|uniref:hypothetical protein n=1 Tax=Rhizobium sp. TaxID=391 RepID=UPI000DD8DA64